jgi:hypothetical protein
MSGVFHDPGNNRLNGMGGNDILEGRRGADTLDGGTGNDSASYESSPAGVWVSVNDPATGAFRRIRRRLCRRHPDLDREPDRLRL